MDIDNLPQRGLVITSQVPSDRQSKLVAGAEDQAVAFGQLETRKPATERVVDVRIVTRLDDRRPKNGRRRQSGSQVPGSSFIAQDKTLFSVIGLYYLR